MLIGGWQKFSLIDYPEKISTIIFTQGCNFRCAYCHNPELISLKGPSLISEKEFFLFLKKRQGKIDAVVITGGEPTLQKDLIEFIKKIKKLGFLVKLDTNGSRPDVLKKLIKQNLLDYVAMDIKAPLQKYKNIVNTPVNLKKIKQSINLLLKSKLNYEFRTTIVKSQLARSDFSGIGALIKNTKLYILQKFVPTKTLDQKFLQQTTYSDQELKKIKTLMLQSVKKCLIR